MRTTYDQFSLEEGTHLDIAYLSTKLNKEYHLKFTGKI